MKKFFRAVSKNKSENTVANNSTSQSGQELLSSIQIPSSGGGGVNPDMHASTLYERFGPLGPSSLKDLGPESRGNGSTGHWVNPSSNVKPDEMTCGLLHTSLSVDAIKMSPSSQSFESITSIGSNCSDNSELERMQREKQELIDKHFKSFPSSLKVDYYDVMILYSENDRQAVLSYRDHLNGIKLDNGEYIKSVLYDDQELFSLEGTTFGHLDLAFEHCTYAFVYLSKTFCEDEWCKLSSEECLMRTLQDQTKKWCVVPIYTTPRNKTPFRIPMGLNALRGVNYYNNDDFYLRGIKKLIGEKVHKRKGLERELFEKRYDEAVKLEQLEIRLEKEKRAMFEEQQRAIEDERKRSVSPTLTKQSHMQDYKNMTSKVINPFPPQRHSVSSQEMPPTNTYTIVGAKNVIIGRGGTIVTSNDSDSGDGSDVCIDNLDSHEGRADRVSEDDEPSVNVSKKGCLKNQLSADGGKSDYDSSLRECIERTQNISIPTENVKVTRELPLSCPDTSKRDFPPPPHTDHALSLDMAGSIGGASKHGISPSNMDPRANSSNHGLLGATYSVGPQIPQQQYQKQMSETSTSSNSDRVSPSSSVSSSGQVCFPRKKISLPQKASSATSVPVGAVKPMQTACRLTRDKDEGSTSLKESCTSEDETELKSNARSKSTSVKTNFKTAASGNCECDSDEETDLKKANIQDVCSSDDIRLHGSSVDACFRSPGRKEERETTVVKGMENYCDETYVKNFYNTEQDDDSNSNNESLKCVDLPQKSSSDLDQDCVHGFTIVSHALTADDMKVAAVAVCVEMGFEEEVVAQALHQLQLSRPGHVHFSLNQMLDKITQLDSKYLVQSDDKKGSETCLSSEEAGQKNNRMLSGLQRRRFQQTKAGSKQECTIS